MNGCEMAKARPCNSCRMRQCDELQCPKWQVWFLDSWAALNRYAWARMDELGRQEETCFTYELPHMVKSPCDSCRCNGWCDKPCSLRIKWWDARMGQMRRKLGDGHALR